MGATREGKSALHAQCIVWATEDIVSRWREYFLNPTDTSSIEEAESDDPPISRCEVTEAVNQLLGGRAPVVDEVRPGFLRALDVVGLSWLTRFCNVVLSGTSGLAYWVGGSPVSEEGPEDVLELRGSSRAALCP